MDAFQNTKDINNVLSPKNKNFILGSNNFQDNYKNLKNVIVKNNNNHLIFNNYNSKNAKNENVYLSNQNDNTNLFIDCNGHFKAELLERNKLTCSFRKLKSSNLANNNNVTDSENLINPFQLAKNTTNNNFNTYNSNNNQNFNTNNTLKDQKRKSILYHSINQSILNCSFFIARKFLTKEEITAKNIEEGFEKMQKLARSLKKIDQGNKNNRRSSNLMRYDDLFDILEFKGYEKEREILDKKIQSKKRNFTEHKKQPFSKLIEIKEEENERCKYQIFEKNNFSQNKKKIQINEYQTNGNTKKLDKEPYLTDRDSKTQNLENILNLIKIKNEGDKNCNDHSTYDSSTFNTTHHNIKRDDYKTNINTNNEKLINLRSRNSIHWSDAESSSNNKNANEAMKFGTCKNLNFNLAFEDKYLNNNCGNSNYKKHKKFTSTNKPCNKKVETHEESIQSLDHDVNNNNKDQSNNNNPFKYSRENKYIKNSLLPPKPKNIQINICNNPTDFENKSYKDENILNDLYSINKETDVVDSDEEAQRIRTSSGATLLFSDLKHKIENKNSKVPFSLNKNKNFQREISLKNPVACNIKNNVNVVARFGTNLNKNLKNYEKGNFLDTLNELVDKKNNKIESKGDLEKPHNPFVSKLSEIERNFNYNENFKSNNSNYNSFVKLECQNKNYNFDNNLKSNYDTNDYNNNIIYENSNITSASMISNAFEYNSNLNRQNSNNNFNTNNNYTSENNEKIDFNNKHPEAIKNNVNKNFSSNSYIESNSELAGESDFYSNITNNRSINNLSNKKNLLSNNKKFKSEYENYDEFDSAIKKLDFETNDVEGEYNESKCNKYNSRMKYKSNKRRSIYTSNNLRSLSNNYRSRKSKCNPGTESDYVSDFSKNSKLSMNSPNNNYSYITRSSISDIDM